MQTTEQALKEGAWSKDEYGGLTLKLGDGYEVVLEPLIFDKQWYLAIYKDQSLVAPKIVIKPGYIKKGGET